MAPDQLHVKHTYVFVVTKFVLTICTYPDLYLSVTSADLTRQAGLTLTINQPFNIL